MLKKLFFDFKARYLLWLLATVLILIAVKFYHYNYIQNIPGQARALRLPGLIEFVCKDAPHKLGEIDQCAKRSIYADGDWGVTAYFTIYGVETSLEANSIAQYMQRVRNESKQDYIPISLQVYSVSRSAGNNGPIPKKYMIAEFNF